MLNALPASVGVNLSFRQDRWGIEWEESLPQGPVEVIVEQELNVILVVMVIRVHVRLMLLAVRENCQPSLLK